MNYEPIKLGNLVRRKMIDGEEAGIVIRLFPVEEKYKKALSMRLIKWFSSTRTYVCWNFCYELNVINES